VTVPALARPKACAKALLEKQPKSSGKASVQRLLVAEDDAAVDAVLAAVLELNPNARCLRLGRPAQNACDAIPQLSECNVYTYLSRELTEWREQIATASRGLARKRRTESEAQRSATDRKIAKLKEALASAERTAFDVAVGDADVLAIPRSRMDDLPRFLGGSDVGDRPIDLCVVDGASTIPPLERLAWLAPAKRGMLVMDAGSSKAPPLVRFVPVVVQGSARVVHAPHHAAGCSIMHDAEAEMVGTVCANLCKAGLRVAATSPYAAQVRNLRDVLPEEFEVTTPERLTRAIPSPPDALVISLALPPPTVAPPSSPSSMLGVLTDGESTEASALARACCHATKQCILVAHPDVLRAVAANPGEFGVLARRALRSPWRPS